MANVFASATRMHTLVLPAFLGRNLKVPSFDLSERKGFCDPSHLVSSADWIPGTATAPVSVSHHNDEG